MRVENLVIQLYYCYLINSTTFFLIKFKSIYIVKCKVNGGKLSRNINEAKQKLNVQRKKKTMILETRNKLFKKNCK